MPPISHPESTPGPGPDIPLKGREVAVVGAGVVGMSTALWLQKSGFDVTVFDPSPPGSGTSSGNACTIADYACIPVNHPKLIWALPKLLLAKDSPLTINPLFALGHLPWLLAFLGSCQPSRVRQTILALGEILLSTHKGLDPLIEASQSADLIRKKGCLYVYQSQESFDAASDQHQARIDHGVNLIPLQHDEIKELEPSLKIDFAKGLFFPEARQVVNPRSLVESFFQLFIDQGGHYRNQSVIGVDCQSNTSIELQLSDDQHQKTTKVAICAGAFSTQIKGTGVEQLPLGCERGYHIQYPDHESMISRPIGWAEAGLYATPTNEGLRFAGTVEIAGIHHPKNPNNLNFLERKANQMFDLDGSPTSDWLGFRPTLPDALPVIGTSPLSKNILLGFGHQHIGLTLAGITGKALSELALDQVPGVDISAFDASRFRAAR